MKKTVRLCFITLTAALVLAGCTENAESSLESSRKDNLNTKLTIIDNNEEQPAVIDNEEQPAAAENADADSGEKRYFRLSVYLGKAESLYFIEKEYAPEDFPEINCTEVIELFPGTLSDVRQQLKYKITNSWAIEKFLRGFELIVYESKESLYKAVSLLGNRKDISAVYYADWAKPGFKPIRGKFAEQGLDVETENQILLDYFYWTTPESMILTRSADSFSIGNYHGTYNGSVAVSSIRNHDGGMYIDTPMVYIIAGVKFVFSGENFRYIWNKGSFYTLQEAYGLHLVTRDDLLAMGGNPTEDKDTTPPPTTGFEPLGVPSEDPPEHLCEFYGYKLPYPYCSRGDDCEFR